MKRLTLTFMLLFVVAACAARAEVRTIKIDLDRESQIYTCGETAQFTIAVLDENAQAVAKGTLKLSFKNDFRGEISESTYDLSQGNPVVVREKLPVPGFLSLSASAEGRTSLAAAAFEPEKIEQGAPMPSDFEAYWRGLQKKLRDETDLGLELEKIDSLSNDRATIYRISVNTLDGARVHGFLGIPTGDGPFPLVVNVPGAGPGTGPNVGWTRNGLATLVMNVFPYACSLDPKERQTQYNEYHKTLASGLRYCYDGAPDRDKYFFRNAYLGIDRAIDYALSRPDIDSSRVGYNGVSQGGASGLILGGLNRKFKWIVSSVPALCDHDGAKKDRSPGWPKIYDVVKDPAVEQMGPYFDAVNFARFIDCPIRVTVGFIDTTCSPSSVYAAYNVIPSTDKHILNEPKLGHGTGGQHSNAVQWLVDNLKRR
ncbi:MAG: acetylxylan esterase [Planctomycetia bacterium]|nr:acetylxylan esterase [Planctomycetia bacterium]